MSYILNIETSTTNCSVSLFKNSELVSFKQENDQNYSHSKSLHVFINDLLEGSKVSPKNLSAISVSKGPGSYTGLRIGVSSAKGLCFALGIPLISVDTLDAFAHQIESPDGFIVPLIDARRMEVYAGMVDAMDTHIGRLLTYLESIDEYDNTIFVFTSDNGAEGSDIITQDGGSVLAPWFERVGYNADYETLGERGSWNAIGSSNATIAASPLTYYKFHASEGGLRVPLVMAGPGIDRRNEISDEFVFVTDLMPTILDLVDVENHGGSWEGREIEPVVGTNFASYLSQGQSPIHEPTEPIGYELGGNSALFKGDYKIVMNRTGQGDTEWSLYDIKSDPSEAYDLTEQKPDLLQAMIADYDDYVAANGVLPMPAGYNRVLRILGPALLQLRQDRP